MSTKAIAIALLTSLSMLTAGCGRTDQGRSASLARIIALEAANGNKPDTFGGSLHSDVVTRVKDPLGNLVPTIFNDVGRVTMAVTLKDFTAGTVPSAVNSITFTHYRIVYRRTDGHNIEGVDVPYSFDSGLTFTVDAQSQAGFEIVRHEAKQQAPLLALQFSGVIISTIADITFYGNDQNGNSVAVTGSIGIDFGDFGDPTS